MFESSRTPEMRAVPQMLAAVVASLATAACSPPQVRTTPATPAVRNCYVDIAPRVCGIDVLEPAGGTKRQAAIHCLQRIESRYANVPDEERADWLVGHGCDPVVVDYAFSRGLGHVRRPVDGPDQTRDGPSTR